MFAYRLYGLRVDSQFELPELSPCGDGTAADVVVNLALPGEVGQASSTEVENGEVVLTVPGVARFTMSEGVRILVEPEGRSQTRDIRLYLLGSAFGAILHQRMLLPIHSNAIITAGGATAFLGRSGSGKSTLATWFHDRGLPILSDDVCVLGKDEVGRVVAHRGIPRLRLWRDSLEASGRVASDHNRISDFADKYALRTGDTAVPDTAIMRAFFLLSDDHPSTGETIITPITGSEAARALIENTYRGEYVRSLGMSQSYFYQCAYVARKVPMFRLRRPWDLIALDAVCERVEAHVRSIVGISDR
jgi:hypothetical protein